MTAMIFTQAVVDGDGAARFLPCELLDISDPVEPGAGGQYSFRLEDGEGAVLAACDVEVLELCGVPQAHVVSALLPQVAGMATAVLARDGKRLGSLELRAEPPTIDLTESPLAGETVSGRRRVMWASSAPDDHVPIGHSVWYRSDGGVPWIPVSLGLAGTSVDIDFDELPGGDAAVLRIDATRGAAVASVTTAAFTVPTARIGVRISIPLPGTSVEAGTSLPAEAAAHDLVDGPIEEMDSFRWQSDHDGSLGVGWRRNLILRSPGHHRLVVEVDTTLGVVSAETSVVVQRAASAVVHRATKGDIEGNSTRLSHLALDGRAGAVVQVTRRVGEGDVGSPTTASPLGVWFDGGHWRIFNQDLTAVSDGDAFSVDLAEPSPCTFVQIGEISGNSCFVSHELCDGDQTAILLVTANWNPNGGPGVYDSAHIGVWFDEATQRWAVFNQGQQPMPAGAAFNVEVTRAGDVSWVHVCDGSNTEVGVTMLDHPAVNEQREAALQVTANWNPRGSAGVYNDHPVATRFDEAAGRWTIFNVDGKAMLPGCAFNVALTTRADGA